MPNIGGLAAHNPIADNVEIAIQSDMKTVSLLAILVGSAFASNLPIDDMAQMFEELIPEIRQYQAKTENELSRLGPPDPNWTTNGLTGAQAITHGGGTELTHVLGEWEVGGHSAKIVGDKPFDAPEGVVRYSVRLHDGPIDYH